MLFTFYYSVFETNGDRRTFRCKFTCTHENQSLSLKLDQISFCKILAIMIWNSPTIPQSVLARSYQKWNFMSIFKFFPPWSAWFFSFLCDNWNAKSIVHDHPILKELKDLLKVGLSVVYVNVSSDFWGKTKKRTKTSKNTTVGPGPPLNTL